MTLVVACALLCGCSLFRKSGGGSQPQQSLGLLSPDADMAAPPVSSAMYELYSWKDEKGWHYSLFKFSEAPKNFAAITASPDVFAGEPELLEKVKTLSKGAQIYWNFRNITGFSLPEEETQKKIYSAARSGGVLMDIIRR
ncbi:MAG TPA: hypothetical protein PLL10_10745 [Elusimicrobiales bacterium]|nr:hypothetical protein [Elusimicrobiales bacterium]